MNRTDLTTSIEKMAERVEETKKKIINRPDYRGIDRWRRIVSDPTVENLKSLLAVMGPSEYPDDVNSLEREIRVYGMDAMLKKFEEFTAE